MINRFMKTVFIGTALIINAEVYQFDGTTSLEELILQSSIPVAIKFYTPWCGTCIAMARSQVFEKISEDSLIKNRVFFIEVDAEKYHHLLGHWNICSVPHIFFLNKGALVADHKGILSFEGLRSKLISLFSLNT